MAVSRAQRILEMVIPFLPEESYNGDDDPESNDDYDLHNDDGMPGYRYQDRGPGAGPDFPDGKRPSGLTSGNGLSS